MSLPPQQPFVPQPPQKTNGLALAGFITSLVCCGPVGLVLSIIGLSQINKNPQEGGKGLAIAGIIIGGIGIVVGIIYYIVVIAVSLDSGY
jgi:hypothetical protein